MNFKVKRVVKLGLFVRQYITDNSHRLSYAYSSDMGGSCGIASWQLMRLANRERMWPQFAIGSMHCWLEYRGYIIDPTATQFCDVPEVYVVEQGGENKTLKREYDTKMRTISKPHLAKKYMIKRRFGYEAKDFTVFNGMPIK